MVSYPLPDDEEGRLEVLRGIGFEPFHGADFVQRLVDIGAGRFDVEYCYIGIIDSDTETFLACAGRDMEPISREDSICTYTIAQDDVLVVENVQEDDRFKDKETIQDLGITWYASAPIPIEGQNIGTFCLADHEQQELTEEDKRHLRAFAAEVGDQIVLRNEIYDRKEEKISGKVAEQLEAFKA